MLRSELVMKTLAFFVLVLFTFTSIAPCMSGYMMTPHTESHLPLTETWSQFISKNTWKHNIVFNDPPEKDWDKTFGGQEADAGYSGHQTSDGGYIITGYTGSYGAGDHDVWLIKTDRHGEMQWHQTFGGSGSDYGSCVQQTSDGGYIITGYTGSFGAGNWDVWLIKTNANGDVQWDQTFGGSNDDAGYWVDQTTTGGYIIVGSTSSFGAGNWDVWLIKTNANGDVQWDQTFGWRNLDIGWTVQQTTDKGYIIMGETESYGPGERNVWLVKVLPEENQPPLTPTISGPTSGVTNTTYTYYTSTTDPDEDDVRYGWDWDGNTKIDTWTVFYYSGESVSTSHSWNTPNTYYVGVKAEDIHGAQSGFSHSLKVVITSNPPNNPLKPTGPEKGLIGQMLPFATSATDPDGDQIQYGWDWNGDDVVDEWTGFNNSGETIITDHVWNTTGLFHVKVKAKDKHGVPSDFSPSHQVVISDGGNLPPNKPSKPSGSTSGRIGVSYTYSTSTIDLDGDRIYYMFDWDDGTDSGRLGPYDSGQTVTASHIWWMRGSYSIKVKAKDEYGAESIWSDPLAVSMPKNRVLDDLFFPSLLNRFKGHFLSFEQITRYSSVKIPITSFLF